MIQIRDGLDSYVSFARSWGTHDESESRLQASPDGLHLGRGEGNGVPEGGRREGEMGGGREGRGGGRKKNTLSILRKQILVLIVSV